MGTSQIPDVRVTLSATGVDDIVRAFQNVAAAAKKSGKDSAAGMGPLNEALKQLKSIVPGLGLAGAAAGVALLLKNAVQTADSIGKLQQKTGLTTETLSTLAFGAEQVDISFESLSGGLVKFNKTMALVDQGNATAGSAVRRLLGSSTALNGLDTDQRFTKVVTALAGMQDGYQKTRAAQDFFGKSGAELIPLIDKLGVGGMDVLRAKAQQLGLVLSQQTVDAIVLAKESMKELGAEAEGTATQFVSGLAPALAQAGEALVEATTGDGVNGFQKIGESIGFVVKGIVGAFILVGSTIGFVFGEASLVVEEWGKKAFKTIDQAVLKTSVFANRLFGRDHAADIAQHELDTKQYSTPTYAAGADDRAKAFKDQLEKQLDDLFHPDKVATKKKTPAGGGSAEETAAQNAHLAFIKAGLQNELALYKAQGDLVAAELQRQYDAGLISIDDYYGARAKAIQENTDKEVGVLQQELALLKSTPIPVAANETDDQAAAKRTQRAQEEAAIVNKIQLLRLAGQKEEADNLDQKFKATKAFNDYRLDVESKIAAAEGNTYAAAIAGIGKADADARSKAHADPTLNAALDKLKVLQKAKAGLDEIDRQGGLALSGLSQQQAALQTQVAAGDIFPFQAIQQYDDAVQKALPHLTDLAVQQMLAAVTPEEILKAQQFSNTVLAMGAASSQSARDLAALRSGVESGLTNSLATFFSTGIDGAHGFANAMGTMALSVINSIQQVVAQLLAAQAAKAILSFFGFAGGGVVPSGGTVGVDSVTTTSASGAVNAADGGAIHGPGTSTSDSIPAMLSAGEFVVRAKAVQQPGVLGMLHEINAAGGFAGIMNRSVRAHRGSYGLPGYAEGGIVAGAALDAIAGAKSGSGGKGQLMISLEEGLVVKHMDSAAGQQATIRSVSKNKNAVKSVIGVGHK